MIKKQLFVYLMGMSAITLAQTRQQPDAAFIRQELKKLNFLGSVLYVAAHPDDENTRIIAYFSNEKLATAGYLSMTRGDGGQNLIGPELRDLLGLIRTQELLGARRIDGGQQFFTRANDFGFSKTAKETLMLWGKDTILSDVVRIFRQFKPDIILTRFPPDERAGHGHHTSSALLALEAFDAAAKPEIFPDQVKQLGVWQPKRLYTNTGRWWNQTINENTPGVVTIDAGGYNPLLGKSYSEMAALARSQHKSQGFGSSGTRGEALEYFEFAKGEKAEKDFFEGINTSWTRLKGGEKIQTMIEKLIADYNVQHPEASVTGLLAVRKEMARLEPGIWKDRKTTEINNIIRDCLGLYMEARADNYWLTPGGQVLTTLEVVNRSGFPVSIRSIRNEITGYDTLLNLELKDNKPLIIKSRQTISSSVNYTDPYWLRESHGPGTFRIPHEDLIGRPQNPPALVYTCSLDIGGDPVVFELPLVFKSTDPIKGELWRPVEIVSPVFVNLHERVLIFKDQAPKTITVLIKSGSDAKLNATIRLQLPNGWQTEPAAQDVVLSRRGEEQTLKFTVIPGSQEGKFQMQAVAEVNGKTYNYSIQTISYDHIPIQTLLPKAKAILVRLNLKTEGSLIGYVKGAGDDVPDALRHMGYEVWEMKNEEVTTENLKKLDAVVVGIRALNTNDRIRYFMPDLLKYAAEGGTLVMQYNTNFDFEIDKDKIAPYSLNLSRDRVTEENSTVTFLKPDHPAMTFPNKITERDFEGWVQERGLYFPDKWDPNFEAMLSMHDEGEQAKNGALLVARYGNGQYIYTGLSFFRQVSEGVPGAYKLLANLVSQGKTKKPQNQKIKNSK